MATSVSFVVTGSGGAGAISTGTMLLEAAGRAGWYGYMTRSVGAQIRGGEAAALVRLSDEPVHTHARAFDLLVALDWKNLGKFAAEMPLHAQALLVGDPAQGEPPPELTAAQPTQVRVPLKQLAQAVRGRPNMVAMGLVGGLIGLPLQALREVVERDIGAKGATALAASHAALQSGFDAAAELPAARRLPPAPPSAPRWIITGNEATGLGAVKGGIRYVAAYPITPATEVLEWLARGLPRAGGHLVQVEDELAAINHIIGASFGGTPALTATSGPGLALMAESLGLAVASETPIVVVDVMRGGPSTGIPAKSEQTDLNIALHGLHGEAPHLVLAPNGVADCLHTTQWAAELAEALQTVALVLSDQALGQARSILPRPAVHDSPPQRRTAPAANDGQRYHRYAVHADGVSPMALPGTAGGEYTGEGLEHNTLGHPSSAAGDHATQLDKRERKLLQHDYGARWADVEPGHGAEPGDAGADTAVLTWGSCTAAAREAVRALAAEGRRVRLVSLRLLSPALPRPLAAALAGVRRLLVVEQSHSGQFLQYLRAHHDLPGEVRSLRRPGPLPIGAHDIHQAVTTWT